jgi:hypothetical protein
VFGSSIQDLSDRSLGMVACVAFSLDDCQPHPVLRPLPHKQVVSPGVSITPNIDKAESVLPYFNPVQDIFG